MKTLSRFVVLTALPLLLRAAQPSQEITVPTVAEAAVAFPAPPSEYRAIHWAIWGGAQSKERIIADIAHIHANGGGVYMINNSRGVQPDYLSPGYMDLVKTVVQECRKYGMKVWIEGDCGYPDGFAGGLISKDYPQLGMQGIVSDAHVTVAAGQTIEIPLPIDTLGIVANARPAVVPPAAEAPAPEAKTFPLPTDGVFKYTVPRGGAGELTVQLPNAAVRYNLTVGEPFSIPVPAGTTSLVLTPGGGAGDGARGRGGRGAAEEAPAPNVVPLPADGKLKWTAPAGAGAWELTFIRYAFRSSPTRNDAGEDGGATKDSLYTLIDYLNPEATETYLRLIYGAYEKAVGDEFGKTVMGFRADESDYTNVNPWTPKLLETFQAAKGYDFKPYIPQIFGGGRITPEAQRAKADYFDVWSAMFRDNFYKHLEDWCTSRKMEFCVHLNHEEKMVGPGEGMISNEGSFWRDMRYVGVPGVDNLNQIAPGIVADFPKLAASAAHLNGHPQVWTESGGAANATGKFVTDYQLVRGINFLNIRGLNVAPAAGALVSPAASGGYVSRASYLLAVGRPAAQVALFHPTDSMWLGDQESDAVTVKLVTQLMEHQIDFDHIDADALATTCNLEGGGLKNLSGQIYRAVIVPTSTVIDQRVLARLKAFAAAGGKVVFVGRTPTMVADRSFLKATGAPDLSFATLEATPEITAKVVAALPKPDVQLDSACPPIKYIHRALKDGDAYFFFNESSETQTRTATLAGSGQVQVWDAATGTIHPLAGVAKASGTVAVPLTLAAQESRFIVIGVLPPSAAAAVPTVATSQTVVTLNGDWSVSFGDKQLMTSLKSWEDLDVMPFTGIASYKREFTAPAAPGKRLYLDLGAVREGARVRVNGKDLEARSWPPYLWDVTSAIKDGANSLDVQVQLAPAGGRGGGGGGGFGGGAAGGRRGAGGAAGGPAGAGEAPGGGAGARGGGGSGGRGGGAVAVVAVAPASGLLGPVRLLAQ